MPEPHALSRTAQLEALLFIYGEPLHVKKIAELLSLSEDAARSTVAELAAQLKDAQRGLRLVSEDESWQLVTKPQMHVVLDRFAKTELSGDLSPASCEALSIICYLGPVSRSRVEYVRGVNCTFTLRNLLLRGLIERIPDPRRPNAYLFYPSLELIRYLGLGGKEDLPEYGKFQKLFEAFQEGREPAAEPTETRERTE